jgi:hypothetical protein
MIVILHLNNNEVDQEMGQKCRRFLRLGVLLNNLNPILLPPHFYLKLRLNYLDLLPQHIPNPMIVHHNHHPFMELAMGNQQAQHPIVKLVE